MSDKITKSPQIRFAGFTDAWEERELGEMLEERNEQIPEDEEYPLMSFVQGIGVTPKGDRYDRSFLVKDGNKKYKKTELGDFIYSSNNLETGSIGFNKTGKAVISPVYSIFSSKNNLESQFIGILSTRKDFIGKMLQFRQGVVYGQWRIHEKDFLEIQIAVPSHDEQKKIFDLFVNLDNLIALHQRKLELMKDTKKSLLQKMFPKDGANVPEIRFAGFTDAWEQRKVGDIGAIRTCKRIFKEQTKEEGDIPFYKNGTLGLKADAYIARDIYEEYKKLYPFPKVGDVLMSVVGSIGRTAEYKGNDEYFQDSNIVWLDTDSNVIDKRFLQISYQIIDWIIEGSTVKHLYNDNILASRIWMTSLDEQRKIGEYFYSLDYLITLHQRELNLLKDLKKSMLQQMFI